MAIPAACSCPHRFADLLAGWTEVLERRLRSDLPSEGPPSVLLHAGCSPSCGLQALLRMRAASMRPTRLVVRSAPPLPDLRIGEETTPIHAAPLLAASTVFLTAARLVSSDVPPAFRSPVIRRVYFPPLSLWRSYLERLPADPLAATEVFAVLVDDGMPVLDALVTSTELSL